MRLSDVGMLWYLSSSAAFCAETRVLLSCSCAASFLAISFRADTLPSSSLDSSSILVQGSGFRVQGSCFSLILLVTWASPPARLKTLHALEIRPGSRYSGGSSPACFRGQLQLVNLLLVVPARPKLGNLLPMFLTHAHLKFLPLLPQLGQLTWVWDSGVQGLGVQDSGVWDSGVQGFRV